MDQTASVWLVLISALIAANLPFVNNRWLAVIPREETKTLWLRLGELFVFYFLVGGIGLALEQSAGQIYPQGWEFYAITGTMFVTLAFPGFVYRYLMHRQH